MQVLLTSNFFIMCGVACYIGKQKEAGLSFANQAKNLLKHRGPDDHGIFSDDNITMLHMRLSILELSELGHQPMTSSCGRYKIIFNGEIYNHLDLRKKYLSDYSFKGHSDTETIIELFRLRQEKMLDEMVGMWAIIIWDNEKKKAFVSRDRYGQKPMYTRYFNGGWYISSEMKPILEAEERPTCNSTAVVEFIALGNYGHLGTNTFFADISQFPQGSYAWLSCDSGTYTDNKYWTLPNINNKDKVPFDKKVQKQLHDLIVEAVLSQTLADVPIGITLSGGVDSSIVAGILATYYDKEIHIFTAQSTDSKFDETRYVDAVIKKYDRANFIMHRKNLNKLSIREDLGRYISIQEEPFGDPSIIAHGFLMTMAADAGIKVILNGQGADELFFGYNNMAQAILLKQFKSFQFSEFYSSLKMMKLGKSFMLRTLLKSLQPGLEHKMRVNSRIKRRSHIVPSLLKEVDERLINLQRNDNIYNVWAESIYGVHIPHLVHYDDRNGMACSIEGRMPFLDHRIADFVATIQPEEFLKNGLRKYILRETCKDYLPQEIFNRTDKIGFFTPLVDMVIRDKEWISGMYKNINFVDEKFKSNLMTSLASDNMSVPDALHIWRQLSVYEWMQLFNVKSNK